VHLIKNDQLVQMISKIELRLHKLGAILLGFKIEIKGIAGLSDFKRERRLANLTRSKQGHSRRRSQGFYELGVEPTGYHVCKYGVSLPEMQG
jgi:hypothetical protein